jgi:ferrous iron transport protein A
MSVAEELAGRERRGAAVGYGGSRRPLAELAPGARATVVEVVAGAPETARRLGALGFTPGAVVEVVRRAPLRDPVVYRVKDYEICLRRAQAACVSTVEADGAGR